MTLVLALGHKSRQGKDEAAKHIIAQRGVTRNVRRYAFGDALKIEVNAAIEQYGSIVDLFAEMDSMLPPWVVIESDPDMTDPLSPYGKYRTLLQWWGTEYRRAQDPDYWVKRCVERIAEENPAVAIITDLRFLNEADWVWRVKGRCIKVTRTGFRPLVNQHQSELVLDSVSTEFWDYLISASTIPELHKSALAMFDWFNN